jgi:hypothetical protein
MRFRHYPPVLIGLGPSSSDASAASSAANPAIVGPTPLDLFGTQNRPLGMLKSPHSAGPYTR